VPILRVIHFVRAADGIAKAVRAAFTGQPSAQMIPLVKKVGLRRGWRPKPTIAVAAFWGKPAAPGCGLWRHHNF
jgi:hypothetical protein